MDWRSANFLSPVGVVSTHSVQYSRQGLALFLETFPFLVQPDQGVRSACDMAGARQPSMRRDSSDSHDAIIPVHDAVGNRQRDARGRRRFKALVRFCPLAAVKAVAEPEALAYVGVAQ
jgi:hypothetical protein